MALSLHIVLERPPAEVHFGLQKGSGNNYETVQVQLSGLEDLYFNFSVEVKGDRLKDKLPRLRGPFVQGQYPDNFIYIDIGTYAGQTSVWGRRLKIPLTGITWEIADQLTADPRLILQTGVPGKAKDGSPNCATVKPFAGWMVVSK